MKSKRDSPARAADLYTSALFTKCRRLAETRGDRWYILSAKHGLVPPDRMIEPYEETLNAMPADAQRAWSKRVVSHVLQQVSSGDELTFLAGQRYRENVLPALQGADYRVHVPMEGLGIAANSNGLTGSLQMRT